MGHSRRHVEYQEQRCTDPEHSATDVNQAQHKKVDVHGRLPHVRV